MGPTTTHRPQADYPPPPPPQLLHTYIQAVHILHHKQVLDAYGHLSVRHPDSPSHFLMGRYLPPSLIASPSDDILAYNISDASPVDPSAPKGYTERFIHSEIYQMYPDAMAVVHSHSNAVLPFGLVRNQNGQESANGKHSTGVKSRLRACTNTAGFLGNGVPVFDARDFFRDGDIKDHLIRSSHLGVGLAKCFGDEEGNGKELKRSVVLMRGHGMTVVGASIEHCVFRAVYAHNNAVVQMSALMLRNCLASGQEEQDEEEEDGLVQGIRYMDEDEIADSIKINVKTALRPWKAWAREAEASGMYVTLV